MIYPVDSAIQLFNNLGLLASTIGEAVNDDSQACDNIFQTSHLISRNLVTLKFLSKDSRMLLTCYGQIDQRKTLNKRPVTVFWKLAIFLATVGFGANFTVRAPKRRSDDQQQNTS